MKILTTDQGFSISSAETSYFFVSTHDPIMENGLLTLIANGIIPTPELQKSDRLILPVDEGIAIEVGKKYTNGELDINNIKSSFLRREGIMSMLVIERNKEFLLICLENGIDANYSAIQKDDMYHLEMHCSTPHKVYYGIFPTLVKACNAYKKIKNITPVTLSEKLHKFPEIKKLIGGIFWIWNNSYNEIMYADHDVNISPVVGDDLLSIADDMKDSGIDNAMFGIFFDGDSKYTKELYEKYGYICTQYDNYNDVFNPDLLSLVPNNRVKNCGYTYRRIKDYPNGITVLPDGNFAAAWSIKGFDGNMYDQNTLCPKIASKRMKEEIPEILRKYPCYKGRFIDVFGTNVIECFSNEHPLTKEECLMIKKDTFKFLGDIGLIAGTEDGFDDLVDELVYTEGIHSPVYFRNYDSGRKHANCYTPERTEHIKKQMLNPSCRVPLWHLVYHDCLLAFPYWGDSTEASHEIIDDKILYSCLFGCPPLYSFSVKDYEMVKSDILKSYKRISSVLQHTALLPMTDYEVLNEDYTLQRTVFGEKFEVIANFSEHEISYKNHLIAPKDFCFEEIV